MLAGMYAACHLEFGPNTRMLPDLSKPFGAHGAQEDLFNQIDDFNG